jgi:Xaa-Pro aminopeptidase
MNLAKAKIDQAIGVLRELDIDMWLTLCRESSSVPDPVTDLIVGHGVMWLSCFFITQDGRTIALVGSADAANYQRSDLYQEVKVYTQDVGRDLKDIVEKFNPRRIAINYSQSNYTADGLSHGLFLLLQEWLQGTPYVDRLVSAEEIIARVRGRKTREEIGFLEKAAVMADECWHEAHKQIKVGMTEIQIAALLEQGMRKRGVEPSFETIVNAGAKTEAGHGMPSAAVLEKGDLLHVDFGVRLEAFCSDIQRLAYFRKDHEKIASPELSAAFNKVKSIIQETAKLYKPGALGYEIDAVARKMLLDDKYPVYDHGLGHQIGRAVHDGAASVAPLWSRYGNMPRIPLEAGNCFTAELGIKVDGIGYVGLEEDLIVTAEGGRFLGPCQIELILK